MHTVAAADLQSATPVEDTTVYILPDGRRGITAGKDSWGNYNLQILDDNDNFVDTISVTAEDLMQYEKLSGEQASAIEQIAQDPETAVEVAAAQGTAAEQEQLPLDKNGNIDYDTLLVQSPTRFLQELANEMGSEEVAKSQLQVIVGNLDKQLEQVTGKLGKATSINETVQLQQQMNKISAQRESLASLLGTPEGTVQAEPATIQASEEIFTVPEEIGTENVEIVAGSEEIGTENGEIGTPVEVEQTTELTNSVNIGPAKT